MPRKKKEEAVKMAREESKEEKVVIGEDEGLNWGRLFLGTLLVIWGLSMVGGRLGLSLPVIGLNWLRLWPILLIMLGLSMLSWRGWLGTILGFLLTISVITLVLSMLLGNDKLPRINWNWKNNLFLQNITSKEERKVSGFEAVEISGISEVEIIQGSKEGVIIEADEELLPEIESRVEDGRLYIGFRGEGWWRWLLSPKKKIGITVYCQELKEIVTSGAGTIKADDLTGERIKIITRGAVSSDLGLNFDELEVEISGAGKFVAEGRANKERIIISGAGKYDGENLISQEAEVRISGSGKVGLTVKEKLTVNISGNGLVEYNGDPVVDQRISGSGRVERVTELMD